MTARCTANKKRLHNCRCQVQYIAACRILALHAMQHDQLVSKRIFCHCLALLSTCFCPLCRPAWKECLLLLHQTVANCHSHAQLLTICCFTTQVSVFSCRPFWKGCLALLHQTAASYILHRLLKHSARQRLAKAQGGLITRHVASCGLCCLDVCRFTKCDMITATQHHDALAMSCTVQLLWKGATNRNAVAHRPINCHELALSI